MLGCATYWNACRRRPQWKIARHFCRGPLRPIHVAGRTDHLGQVRFIERLRCTCASMGSRRPAKDRRTGKMRALLAERRQRIE